MSDLLLLDCGNSRIKWQWRRAGSVQQQGIWSDGLVLPAAWSTMRPAVIWGSSVRAVADQKVIEQTLHRIWDVPIVWATSTAQLAGVVNGYERPELLGVDRWLTLLACHARFADPCVIIDAGTAVTVDFLGMQGCHAGGYIVPGMTLMHGSLCRGTARLREPWETPQNIQPARQTKDAINRGLLLLMAGLMHEVRQQALDLWPGKTVQWVLTGGGISMLNLVLDQLPGGVHTVPDLVLDGLYLWGVGCQTPA